MEEDFNWNWFVNNLWERENAMGLKGIEGKKTGYWDGKYHAYTTPNGNEDVGPGFDLKYQTPEFVRKARTEGFTKDELDSIVKSSLQNENRYFNQRISREGGDTASIPNTVRAGLLDMYHQVNNGLYGYDNFWKAVADQNYPDIRKESLVKYKDKKKQWHEDRGRQEFRNGNYFNMVVNQAPATKPKSIQPQKWEDLEFKPAITFSDGGSIRRELWNNLSMAQRADVIKLAVENGIHDLDTIRSAYNEFAEGGSIHIKPSHRGRLTELKERTGKTEAELYNDGNPAHKKMVVFARNSRRWKHG